MTVLLRALMVTPYLVAKAMTRSKAGIAVIDICTLLVMGQMSFQIQATAAQWKMFSCSLT